MRLASPEVFQRDQMSSILRDLRSCCSSKSHVTKSLYPRPEALQSRAIYSFSECCRVCSSGLVHNADWLGSDIQQFLLRFDEGIQTLLNRICYALSGSA